LTENLLRPALTEAGKILPRNVNATIDGFAARDGIIYSGYEGILAAPMQSEPPFEIVLETPHHAPMDLQVQALVVAVRTILSGYRQLISFAANL
jgi:murein peptide amidase A